MRKSTQILTMTNATTPCSCFPPQCTSYVVFPTAICTSQTSIFTFLSMSTAREFPRARPASTVDPPIIAGPLNLLFRQFRALAPQNSPLALLLPTCRASRPTCPSGTRWHQYESLDDAKKIGPKFSFQHGEARRLCHAARLSEWVPGYDSSSVYVYTHRLFWSLIFSIPEND